MAQVYFLQERRIALTSSHNAKIPAVMPENTWYEAIIFFKELLEHCCTSNENVCKSSFS